LGGTERDREGGGVRQSKTGREEKGKGTGRVAARAEAFSREEGSQSSSEEGRNIQNDGGWSEGFFLKVLTVTVKH
jgi:hypothetical protein